MTAMRSLGRQFGWLWAAFAVSTVGRCLAFDAFPLIAILVLHSGPTEVSLLASAGRAVGAVVAVPLGPWVEFRRKRPVMVGMDLGRFVAVISVPVAFALGSVGLAFIHPGIIGLRAAIALAGVLLLVTPLLLPRRDHAQGHKQDLAPSQV
jgi:hypothetical protein